MLFAKKKRVITRLLVVEDEPLVAFDTEYALSDSGYEIIATVDRVADALRVIGEEAVIDLILVDVTLADGSGLDVAREALVAGITVLFVTGGCPPEGRSLAAGCLSKPYAHRDLLDAIDAVDATLGGRKPRRSPSGFTLFASAGNPTG